MKSFGEWAVCRSTRRFDEVMADIIKSAGVNIPNIQLLMQADTQRLHGRLAFEFDDVLKGRIARRLECDDYTQIYSLAIRHRILNYDKIWQAVEVAWNSGKITECEGIYALLEAYKQEEELCPRLLNAIYRDGAKPEVNWHGKKVPVERAPLEASLNSYLRNKKWQMSSWRKYFCCSAPEEAFREGDKAATDIPNFRLPPPSQIKNISTILRAVERVLSTDPSAKLPQYKIRVASPDGKTIRVEGLPAMPARRPMDANLVNHVRDLVRQAIMKYTTNAESSWHDGALVFDFSRLLG